MDMGALKPKQAHAHSAHRDAARLKPRSIACRTSSIQPSGHFSESEWLALAAGWDLNTASNETLRLDRNRPRAVLVLPWFPNTYNSVYTCVSFFFFNHIHTQYRHKIMFLIVFALHCSTSDLKFNKWQRLNCWLSALRDFDGVHMEILFVHRHQTMLLYYISKGHIVVFTPLHWTAVDKTVSWKLEWSYAGN